MNVMYIQQVGNGVYVGDTVVDADPREKGKRTGEVVAFRSDKKICGSCSNDKTKHLCEVKWSTGKKTWIDLRRCHEDPNRKTGYRLRLTSPWRSPPYQMCNKA